MDLSVNIGSLRLKNPVIAASGTFGYGAEYRDLAPARVFGAVIAKTITRRPREGNPQPRLAETAAGMLNAIGLQNEGLDDFIAGKLPELRKLDTEVIVSISGECAADFAFMARALEKAGVNAVELNLSCPNLKNSGSAKRCRMFAQDEDAVSEAVYAARKDTRLTLIAKLSPNVTDIVSIAAAAQEAGADALSLVNTFVGMAIDVERQRPKLANVTGGLSGPAIKPLALRMVYETARDVRIPLIGMGGIFTAEDALEFFIAGAGAVCLGTVNFVNPGAAGEILAGIKAYLKKKNLNDIKDITGCLKT